MKTDYQLKKKYKLIFLMWEMLNLIKKKINLVLIESN